jgi:hypothetical protein
MSKYIPLLSIFFLFCSCWIGIPWETTKEIIEENYPDDNPIEETVEKWIEDETGIEVDFSGRSKEDNPYN